jgi:kynurenine formamidase
MFGKKTRFVDLTHPIHPAMPVWPDDPAIEIEPWSSVQKDGFLLHRLSIGEHSGTHLGAPSHFDPLGISVEQVPLETLCAPAIKIHLQADATLVTRQEIDLWESKHGRIPANVWMVIESGWSSHWLSEEVQAANFPGISEEAVRFLCIERHIAGIGIDTPGVDGGQSRHFAANRCLAENGAWHLENLCNLDQLPDSEFWLFIGALPIVNGSGSPCRVLAMIQAEPNDSL